MNGTPGLVAQWLYGTGMRLLEALRLRVKDVEFARREVIVREGKGGKDRVTVLPENLMAPLQAQIHKARALHDKNVAPGMGTVYLPRALAVKFPGANRPGSLSHRQRQAPIKAQRSSPDSICSAGPAPA